MAQQLEAAMLFTEGRREEALVLARQAGVVFHMVSALAAGGFVGLTAIGSSAADAQAFYNEVKRSLDEETDGYVPA